MATQGASQLSAKRIRLFDIAHTPQSSGLSEGLVAVHVTSPSDDDLAVDIPTSASAVDGGRAFAGIVMDFDSASTTQDASVLLQLAGFAKCRLKASTAVTRGQDIGYDPADAGVVQPITSANAGTLVRIGKAKQSKASSASVQYITVHLDGAPADVGARNVSVITAASSTITNSTAETAFSTTFSIPANRLRVGSVINLRARASVSSVNGTGTNILTLRARLTNASGTLLGAGPAVDVTNGGGDVGDIDLQLVVRSIGASGTVMSVGKIGLLTAVTSTGSSGVATVDTTAAITLVITAQWSAASASNVVALDGGSLQIIG